MTNKTTILVLAEFATECDAKATVLINEAARIGRVYGPSAYVAVRNLQKEAQFLDQQSEQAVEAIGVLKGLIADGKWV